MQTSLWRSRKVLVWLDERLALTELLEYARHKTVPEHKHSFWYYWGGISMFFFLIQVFTGVLLMVYYRPGAESYESVREITYDIRFGWLIRSAHSWSANLMVLAVFIHMFSVFFMKAYRKPREFGWWSGLALLALTMTFGFSGYLLPMDELAYFATKVGLELPASLPLVGKFINDVVRGGPEVGSVTIQRFFALHVVVLPLIFIPVLAFHLWLVQKHGNALPPSEEQKPIAERRSIPFFPDFFSKDLAMWLVALNVLAILASLYPWQLGPQADPLAPAPAGIHPEWYFMSQFQLLKLFGRWFPGVTGEVLGLVFFTLILLLWAIVPLYDTGTAAGRRAKVATWFGITVLALLIVTTIWGYWEVL
ncbi:MAG: cytochrome bc complex cytochrome b subunit [Acidobacteriota bacterium]|nr:cytochrome bc complex cytochrome b subunit [Blastocatellia bacterium]MDW8412437.1 cytochrome bc complex cytochrome b subunit [Acidobacteriota bacterium]